MVCHLFEVEHERYVLFQVERCLGVLLRFFSGTKFQFDVRIANRGRELNEKKDRDLRRLW